MGIICIRGAITSENTKEDILEKTKILLLNIIEKNQISIEDIISITFTATKDLDKVYPAVAARGLGITSAALMCMNEMYVEGSLKSCIRVALTTISNKKQSEALHIYLEGAKILRPDIIS